MAQQSCADMNCSLPAMASAGLQALGTGSEAGTGALSRLGSPGKGNARGSAGVERVLRQPQEVTDVKYLVLPWAQRR